MLKKTINIALVALWAVNSNYEAKIAPQIKRKNFLLIYFQHIYFAMTFWYVNPSGFYSSIL